MNAYKVSYAVQTASGKINKADSIVIADSCDRASEAIMAVYAEVPAMHVAITSVEALAAGELF